MRAEEPVDLATAMSQLALNTDELGDTGSSDGEVSEDTEPIFAPHHLSTVMDEDESALSDDSIDLATLWK